MKMMKKMLALLFALVMVLGLVSCASGGDDGQNNSDGGNDGNTGANDAGDTGGTSDGEPIKIGVAACHYTNSWNITNTENLVETFENAGYEVVWNEAKNDTATQVANGNDLIAQGIDYLIMKPKEEEGLVPAIEACKAEGINVTGPVPPDTVFLRAVKGEFDMVVAQYHDQGHIPLKMLAFDSGVNITVGLDVVRTSVDHGTAFDIAGKGIAKEDSLLKAIEIGEKL